MVALPQAVDVEKQAGQGGNSVLIPKGKYPAVILNSELKNTSSGDGKRLVFQIMITKGEYEGTEFTEGLNVVNNNEEAVKIAYQTIANMGKALSLSNVRDSSELHNKPLVIGVETEEAEPWVDNKGVQREGKDKSVVKKYFPMPANGVLPVNAPVVAETKQEKPKQEAAAAPKTNPFAPPQ